MTKIGGGYANADTTIYDFMIISSRRGAGHSNGSNIRLKKTIKSFKHLAVIRGSSPNLIPSFLKDWDEVDWTGLRLDQSHGDTSLSPVSRRFPAQSRR